MTKVTLWLSPVLLVPAFAPAQSAIPRRQLAAVDDCRVRAKLDLPSARRVLDSIRKKREAPWPD